MALSEGFGQPDKHDSSMAEGNIHLERPTHPEIELRSMIWPKEDFLFFSAPQTKLDILEIYPDGRISQEEGIGHERFTSYCETRTLNGECIPALRMIMIDSLVVPAWGECPEDKTAYLLHQTFHVPMSFLRKLDPTFQSSQNERALFVRRGPDGGAISIDGHYKFYRGVDSSDCFTPCCAWFSQSVAEDNHTATYLIHNGSESLKKIFLAVRSDPVILTGLCRPLAFHGLLLEDAIVVMKSETYVDQLKIAYNLQVSSGSIRGAVEPEIGQDSTRTLNGALISLCTVRGHFSQIIAILVFLKRVHKQYVGLVSSDAKILEVNQVSESLACLKEDADGMIICLRQSEDKAAIKFNMDITLQNEKNNKINTEIARLTAQIAVDSKRDSSSMITMAVVTMFFLPGTFMSALFSMVFFNVSTDPSGKMSFTVSPFWWLYPAVTIPLTITVFAVWRFWQKRRSLAMAHDLRSVLNPPTEDPNLEAHQNKPIRTEDKESKGEVKKSARSLIMKKFLRRVGRARKRSPQMPLNTGDISQMDD